MIGLNSSRELATSNESVLFQSGVIMAPGIEPGTI